MSKFIFVLVLLGLAASAANKTSVTLRLDDVTGARPVWHVGLYKNYEKHPKYKMQICGGSVLRVDVVITAAHCVWGDGKLEAVEKFAVGGNKVHRPYGDLHDKKAQLSDVKEIIVPPRFRGVLTSLQDDIALLKLVTPFKYDWGLRPVCVNFDDDFDTQQLSEGNYGTASGWGYTKPEGMPTPYLQWLELPFVSIEKCLMQADNTFLKYITSDKICAGEMDTGKALCKGDSGAGLVFWDGEPSSPQFAAPFLRGIASASARADTECNVNVVGLFTQLTKHRLFLLKHVPDLGEREKNCRFLYTQRY